MVISRVRKLHNAAFRFFSVYVLYVLNAALTAPSLKACTELKHVNIMLMLILLALVTCPNFFEACRAFKSVFVLSNCDFILI